DPEHNRILTYAPEIKAFVPLWETTQPSDSVEDCDFPQNEPPDAYHLSRPRGLAFSPDGDLVVADSGHRRIIFYSWTGLAPRNIIEIRDGEPADIAYDNVGRLYVADELAGIVRRYDRLWREDTEFYGGRGVLIAPRHLAISDEGNIFVVDMTD